MGPRYFHRFAAIAFETVFAKHIRIADISTGKTIVHVQYCCAIVCNVLQITLQFIEERLEMLNTGSGFSDEFEMETFKHFEKSGRRGKHYKDFLRNMKDKVSVVLRLYLVASLLL